MEIQGTQVKSINVQKKKAFKKTLSGKAGGMFISSSLKPKSLKSSQKVFLR